MIACISFKYTYMYLFHLGDHKTATLKLYNFLFGCSVIYKFNLCDLSILFPVDVQPAALLNRRVFLQNKSRQRNKYIKLDNLILNAAKECKFLSTTSPYKCMHINYYNNLSTCSDLRLPVLHYFFYKI